MRQVAVNTVITDVNAFLDHIVAATNMRCLTPPSALTGTCGFLAANLYAKSVFGEDALVNVSIEQGPDGRLAGFIRIRCANSLRSDSVPSKAAISSYGVPILIVQVVLACIRFELCHVRVSATSMRLNTKARDPPLTVSRMLVVRSKTQGIALSLGDKLILKQKG